MEIRRKRTRVVREARYIPSEANDSGEGFVVDGSLNL